MPRAACFLCCLIALAILFGWGQPADTSAYPAALGTVVAVSPAPETSVTIAPEHAPHDLDAITADATSTPTSLASLEASADIYLEVEPSSLPLAFLVNAAGGSTVERANAILQAQGTRSTLVIVSPASQGVELAIYRDLRARHYRTTTGPDEGFDTHSLACYPNCVFVPIQEINVLSVNTWLRVLRHEVRHMTQAANNPRLAADFRDANGTFTSYGMFSEVCADYGLNVAYLYRAQYRMTALRAWLGRSRYALINRACAGDKPAYDSLVQFYNRVRRSSRAFALLFPRYR